MTTCWEARQLAGIAKTAGWSRHDTTLWTMYTDASLPSCKAATRGNFAHTSANAKSTPWNGLLVPSRRLKISMIHCGRAARTPPCGSNMPTIGFDFAQSGQIRARAKSRRTADRSPRKGGGEGGMTFYTGVVCCSTVIGSKTLLPHNQT